MSIVKLNAITVPRDRFEEFERRFASRAGRVSGAPGFEGFELQLRIGEQRTSEILLAKVHPVHLCRHQVCTLKMRGRQIGAAKVGIQGDRQFQMRPGEVGTTEIGKDERGAC